MKPERIVKNSSRVPGVSSTCHSLPKPLKCGGIIPLILKLQFCITWNGSHLFFSEGRGGGTLAEIKRNGLMIEEGQWKEVMVKEVIMEKMPGNRQGRKRERRVEGRKVLCIPS